MLLSSAKKKGPNAMAFYLSTVVHLTNGFEPATTRFDRKVVENAATINLITSPVCVC